MNSLEGTFFAQSSWHLVRTFFPGYNGFDPFCNMTAGGWGGHFPKIYIVKKLMNTLKVTFFGHHHETWSKYWFYWYVGLCWFCVSCTVRKEERNLCEVYYTCTCLIINSLLMNMFHIFSSQKPLKKLRVHELKPSRKAVGQQYLVFTFSDSLQFQMRWWLTLVMLIKHRSVPVDVELHFVLETTALVISPTKNKSIGQ